MVLGNEARTEPRIAKLEIRKNSLGATNNGGRWSAEAATAAVADPAKRTRTSEVLSYRWNCQRSLCAVALVKQDRLVSHLQPGGPP